MGRAYLNAGNQLANSKVMPAPPEKVIEYIVSQVDRPVEVIVEKPVYVDRVVEKIVEVEKVVYLEPEKQVVVEKEVELVQIEVPVYYETVKTVEVFKSPKSLVLLAAVQAVIIIALLAF